MAAKGSKAKENVKKVIANAFGDNFVGEADKKLYVWADDGGETVQIAITMTMPKNPIGTAPKNSNDWTDSPVSTGGIVGNAGIAGEGEVISEEDEAKIQALMKELDIMD